MQKLWICIQFCKGPHNEAKWMSGRQVDYGSNFSNGTSCCYFSLCSYIVLLQLLVLFLLPDRHWTGNLSKTRQHTTTDQPLNWHSAFENWSPEHPCADRKSANAIPTVFHGTPSLSPSISVSPNTYVCVCVCVCPSI